MTTRVREGAVGSAKAIANFFVERGLQEGVPIDHLKLQKLTYYAHAWHLGYGLGPLFPDDIEAWPHGPVVRDLYVEFKRWGRSPIRDYARDFTGESPRIDRAVLPETAALLDAVWDTYRQNTGIQLSNSTHNVGEPWAIIAERYSGLADKPRIPNELIESVFARRVQEPELPIQDPAA